MISREYVVFIRIFEDKIVWYSVEKCALLLISYSMIFSDSNDIWWNLRLHLRVLEKMRNGYVGLILGILDYKVEGVGRAILKISSWCGNRCGRPDIWSLNKPQDVNIPPYSVFIRI